MTSEAVSHRRSAYEDASRSAVAAAGNAAEYLRGQRAARLREATDEVRIELSRRAPASSTARAKLWLLVWAIVTILVSATALIVSSMGLFT